ncbi:MAG TPA: phosphoribosylformylglycinamidine synthase, partial [Clostridiales bacterium]|nr:phosphoribosylformylglycinamidine synthase [Clostridiales bacterium]
CGGATGSSKSHNLTSLESGGAEVQKGNAPEERKIIRLFRNPSVTRLIKRCNDFGAGGVSVAIGELASGLDINLDLIPTKYEGLDGTELAISESQERMAVVVAASDTEMFLRLTKEENLEATAIAQVTDKNRLTMHWQGQTIVDLAREFLDSNGAVKHATVEVSPQKLEHVSDYNSLTPDSLRQGLEMLADDLNHCSQQGLVEQFDSTAGAATVLLPYGGRWQATPAPAMVAKLPLLKGETTTCSGMAFGYNSFLSEQDPYLGAYCAVVESLSKLVACGFDLKHVHLSFQEYFEKLADEPLRWGKPFAALLGALEAQLDFGVAAIGGKDSMSGSFEDLDVPPTLVSFAVAAGSTATIISPEFKKAGSRIVLLEPAAQKDGRPAPAGLLELFELLHQLIKNGQALSVQPLSTGGAAHGLYQMCLGNRIGARLNLLNTASASSLNSSSDNSAATLEADQLFRYAPGSFLVELAAGAELPKLHRPNQTDEFTNPRLTELGQTIESFVIEAAGENISLTELQKLSESKLESIFTFNPPVYQADAKPPKLSYSPADQKQAESISGLSAAPKLHSDAEPKSTAAPRAFLRRSNNPQAQPPALIPAFPGTNCEYDVARALDQAGAKAQILVVRNLTPNDISETIDALAKAIRSSRIIVIPGGASSGNEPDGSGKFITTMFRNPRVQEALDEFLNRRDGLMLGICNGFQALIKLGLVPYGEIREARPDSPTLAHNRIGRHQSRLVHTRIASNLSPWLADCEVGDIFTMPLSNGEGRFVADPALLAELAANGQIAAQYVDLSGEPTSELPWNPSGSAWAVEAITSPDGRILGKMGHSERCGTSVHINVAGRCQPLFESGVKYFL